VPSLFIHGSSDPRSPDGARQIVNVMPNADLVIIEGAGHFPWIERPSETIATIQTFIESTI